VKAMTARRAARAASIGLCAAALALLGACGNRNEYHPPPPPPVTVSKPVRGPVTEYLLATGSVAAAQSVDLVARVEGYLRSVNFTDGTLVKAGQLLFVIEPEPYQAKLASYQAQLENAQSEYNRQLRMIKENATSQANVEKWQSQRDQAAAAVTLATINLAYTRITAPFDGRIGRHLVDPGNLVGAMGSTTKLATLEQVNPVYIYFSINERDVLRIRASALARGVNITGAAPKVPVYVGLQTEPGYPHEGTLDFASTGLDTGSGTLQARAVFANPERILLPGMFARLRIPTAAPKEGMMVPDRVVATDQAGSYVLIVGADHKVLQQRVEIGALQEGGMRVIRSGLDPGSDVVVDGLQNAVPGNLVTPTAQTLTAAAAPSARP
jgi:RND family efflux transporter MFP subunit